MKCPRCGGVLNEYGDLFVCESCGAKFKNKSAQREQKQEEQVVQNTATESVIMPETKNESEKSELELLKERLAEMEKRQSEMESGGSHRNADFKGKFSQIKETKFFGFLKKWGLKVILPCVLAFIVLISLMVSLVGVRGVYYNVNNPNEFYSFSSSKYEYYGDFNGEEYVDKGTWKTKNGKLYLTYKDEEFGKQTDEYYFSKQSNKVIFIGEEKDSLSEFKRVTLSKYKPSSNKKVKITFDANGGSGDTSVSYSFGSKSKEVPQTEREGYFFKGWYKDKYGYKISGSKPYEEGKRVWEDVTYYANWWSDKTYTLTVEGTDIALELEEGDSLLSKLKETEKGYTYDYYIYGELVDENTRMPANSVTISRQQTSVKTIKLTLNAVGGNFNGAGEIIKEVAYNSDFTLDVPKSEGMFFAGYVIYPKNSEACISVATHNGSLTNDFWNNVYEDVTLYASWIDLATELADFEYRINDDGICITKYIGKNAVVKIPDSVTSIGYSAFKGCTGLTNVTIGNGVTSIDKEAFENCSALKKINVSKNNSAYSSVDGILYDKNKTQIIYVPYAIQGSITIPDSVTSIGGSAFAGCSGLTSVTIPNSVTSIGSYAFEGCTKLTSVTIPDSVTSIGYSAFEDCTGLTSISGSATNASTVAKQANPSSFTVNITSGTSIGKDAFKRCRGLTSVTIPDSVTSIGYSAFEDCTGLTSVTIGNGVTSIDKYAFGDCTGLTSIYYTGDVASWCGISGLGTVMSSSRTLYIGGKKVEGDLIIPNSVTSIGSFAFRGCSGLTSVTIGNSVTSIGEYAFYGCSGLTSVTIGNSVTSIGDSAFSYCKELTSIYYAGDVAEWCGINGHGDLMSSTRTLYIGGKKVEGDLVIPYGVTSIGGGSFFGCTELTSITIPNSVTYIGGSAFGGCRGLTNIIIPDSVTSLGYYAFGGCSKLTSITIPDSVTSIGERAFAWCTGLTSVTIGKSVKSIGDGAFEVSGLTSIYYTGDVAGWCGITGLGNVMSDSPTLYIGGKKVEGDLIIPDSVTSIGWRAFYGCTGLTSVTIPDSVTSIGWNAFEDCTGLTSITIPDSVTSIGGHAFDGCKGLTSVTIGNSVTSIGESAFKDCVRLKSMTIPDSVTSIGDRAFLYCPNLTSIVVSENNSAFSSVDGILYDKNKTQIIYVPYAIQGSITIPGSVTSTGSYAFSGCSGLTSVTIGNGVTSIDDGAFDGCRMLTSITISDSIKIINFRAFYDCINLTSINFNGTIAQWNAISKGEYWKQSVSSVCKVICTDGEIPIREA